MGRYIELSRTSETFEIKTKRGSRSVESGLESRGKRKEGQQIMCKHKHVLALRARAISQVCIFAIVINRVTKSFLGKWPL